MDDELGRLSAVPLRSHMLASAGGEVPLDLKSRAGLEGRQRAAPIAVLTSLLLILHLLSISSVLLILRRSSIVAELESVRAAGLVSLVWTLRCLDEN